MRMVVAALGRALMVGMAGEGCFPNSDTHTHKQASWKKNLHTNPRKLTDRDVEPNVSRKEKEKNFKSRSILAYRIK